MPRKQSQKAGKRVSRAEAPPESPSDLRVIANLLGLLAVRGESKQKQIATLTAAGFAIADVAALLRTTTNAVSVALYKERRSQSDRE